MGKTILETLGEQEREEHLVKLHEMLKTVRNEGLVRWQPETQGDADPKESLIGTTDVVLSPGFRSTTAHETEVATNLLRRARDLALVKWTPAFTIHEFEKADMFRQLDELIGEDLHPDAGPRPELEQAELPVWMKM